MPPPGSHLIEAASKKLPQSYPEIDPGLLSAVSMKSTC
jgi:hypothetical protein